MSYLAISRKYRPQKFQDVIHQNHIVKILQNSLKTKKIHHSYIFSGIRGVGKTSVARIFAKALNCEKGVSPEPCNQCKRCKAITEGNFPDVIEIDGASNRGIDQVREIREIVKYSTLEGRYKVVIIDEVHMLTNEAFNALLKTLEEPPPNTVFILATTEFNKLLPTVVSRSIHLDFRRVPEKEIIKHLKKVSELENISYDEWALEKIAEMADGSIRDSLSILEQMASYGNGEVTSKNVQEVFGFLPEELIEKILTAIFSKNKKEIFEIVDTLYNKGVDFLIFYKELFEILREILWTKISGEKPKKWEKTIENLNKKNLLAISDFTLTRMLNVLEKFDFSIKRALNKRFIVELLLLELIYIQSALDVDELLDSITQSEMTKKEEIIIEKKSEKLPSNPLKGDLLSQLKEHFKNDFKVSNSLRFIEKTKRVGSRLLFYVSKENSIVIGFLEEKKSEIFAFLKNLDQSIEYVEFKIIDGKPKKKNIYDEIKENKVIKKFMDVFSGEIIEIKTSGGDE